MAAQQKRSARVRSGAFYQTYHGHELPHLERVLSGMDASRPGASRFFLAGDSSMDNKHWLFPDQNHHEAATQPRVMNDPDATEAACNGFDEVLYPARMVKDISYFVNRELESAEADAFCLNCAVEESTVLDREQGDLLPQDEFIRDNIRSEDTLIVSVGGNDIALRPTLGVAVNMAMLLYCSTHWMIERGVAPGLGFFQNLMGRRVQAYVERLCSVTRPKRVIVTMLYYLDETKGNSWADGVLERLGYDADPSKLQLVMRTLFRTATARIRIPGVDVVAVPMYEVMDGKNTDDYCQRVEPSVAGGEKLGRLFVGACLDAEAATESHSQGEEPSVLRNKKNKKGAK